MRELDAMLVQASIIDSRERLNFIVDSQMASGYVKKGSVRAHLSKLRRIAFKSRAKPATASDLAAMGIPVVMVPKRG